MSLEIKNMCFSYSETPVLKGVSLTAYDGELMAVLGPNGVGKSTLFKCMLSLYRGYSGDCLINGESTKNMSAKQLARRVAYIPQSHYPSFNFSVFDMVLLGTTAQVSSIASPQEKQIVLVEKAMKKLGIDHLRYRGYTQISGGERQLALIARAIVQEARVLVMDEPTSNLDYGNQLRVMAQVRELVSDGYTIIESTHNPEQAYMYADRILAMHDGRVLACGTPQEVLDSALMRRLYDVDVDVHSLRDDTIRVCVPKASIK